MAFCNTLLDHGLYKPFDSSPTNQSLPIVVLQQTWTSFSETSVCPAIVKPMVPITVPQHVALHNSINIPWPLRPHPHLLVTPSLPVSSPPRNDLLSTVPTLRVSSFHRHTTFPSTAPHLRTHSRRSLQIPSAPNCLNKPRTISRTTPDRSTRPGP